MADNVALTSQSGALALTTGIGSAELTGCVIARNHSDNVSDASRAGAIWSDGGPITLRSCTIVDNTADDPNALGAGAALFLFGGAVATIENSVVWGSQPPTIAITGATVNATYSDIQGTWAGAGNIDANPLFVNSAAGDYELQAASPCVDTGNPASPLDSDGTRADMGALSFDQSYLAAGTPVGYPSGTADLTITGRIFDARSVGIAIDIDPSVVVGATLQSHAFESGLVNIVGDTLFISLASSAGVSLADVQVAVVRLDIAGAAPLGNVPLTWYSHPVTHVDELDLTTADGNLTVFNDPPVWVLHADTVTIDAGSTLVFPVSANDPNVAQTLTYTTPALPSGADFDLPSTTLTWTPSLCRRTDATAVFSVSDGVVSVNDTLHIVVRPFYGDVTTNGDIAALDASWVLQYSVRLLGSIDVARADISANGLVSSYDAALILYRVVSPAYEFPVCGGEAVRPAIAGASRAPILLAWRPIAGGWSLGADDLGIVAGIELAIDSPSGDSQQVLSDHPMAVRRHDGVLSVALAYLPGASGELLRVITTSSTPPTLSKTIINDGVVPVRAWRPTKFAFHQNTPNPFNPSTTLGFDLPETDHVRLAIFTAGGQLVRTLVDGELPFGAHEITWNGKDSSGRPVASGVYLCRITAGTERITRKMTLLR